MPLTDDRDIVADRKAFTRHATIWIDSFFEDIDPAMSAEVHLRYHGQADFPDPRPKQQPPRCLLGRRENRHLILHVCEDHLAGMPPPALQAALDMELALFTLERTWDAFKFNFQNKILASLNVSGGAVHVIRKMVWHLENALKLQSATNMILGLDRGLPQVFYYFHVLNRSAGDGTDYERLQQHDWIKGLYLCQKGETYLSVFLLQQAGLSSELVNFWEQFHPFLLPRDRRFLDRLARQALSDHAFPFADRVVRVFDIVRRHLSL